MCLGLLMMRNGADLDKKTIVHHPKDASAAAPAMSRDDARGRGRSKGADGKTSKSSSKTSTIAGRRMVESDESDAVETGLIARFRQGPPQKASERMGARDTDFWWRRDAEEEGDEVRVEQREGREE